MAAATGPTLALPAGGRERSRSALPLAALLLSTAGLMLFGALVGAYLHLRTNSDEWPPGDIHPDFYLGNTMLITILLSAFTVEWAYSAVRRAERRQALVALGITVGLGLAFLNLLWYTASRAGYGVASHPYGTVVTALAVLLGLAVAAAVVFAILTLLRVAGAQVTASRPEQARAAAWVWQFSVVASIAVWYTVVVLK